MPPTTRKPPVKKNDLAAYLFHEGTNYYAYDYLGVHKNATIFRGRPEGGYVFRTWVPRATEVALVGDFCGWDEGVPMKRVTPSGVWEAKIKKSDIEGGKYKFKITSQSGKVTLKSDPYAVYSETLFRTASIVHTRTNFEWSDERFTAIRKTVTGKRGEDFYSAPLNIYELHLSSWQTREGKGNENGDAYLNYREIADLLVPYVRQMGYTHVELLPVAEHPYDGSWGYQATGYYAPTSRFGTPEDFKYFVNHLHCAGVGVLLDWVPAHFPKDEHGLIDFDGTPTYEFQGVDRMEHHGWGTRCFDIARNEVQSFLVSNALYWLREFHIDGLRVDAVASMLYLDYDRRPGEWNPNKDGGNKSYEAIAFFQKLNSVIFGEFPDVLMIAEESTAWPRVTHPVSEGGLGFNLKWNMGYANDMFEYMSTDPYFRAGRHNCLTFPMMYAMSENYILPVSHDEVVHGKHSLIEKQWGEYEQKFAGARAFELFRMTHPGKKLTFMGCEFGQFREWDYKNSLEWFMLDFPRHKQLQRWNADLNNFYLEHSELWERDFSWSGFSWILPDARERNTVAYKRYNAVGDELVIAVNFSAAAQEIDLEVGGRYASYSVILDSDAEIYGGATPPPRRGRSPHCSVQNVKDGHITVTLPPLSGVVMRGREKT